MAWNDPFETLVETQVVELGEYLQSKGNLDVYEIARIQEVCRDFCNFLCKDVRKATNQDYTVYQQLHSINPGDEADYSRMLQLIREFCNSTVSNAAGAADTAAKPSGKKMAGAINSMFLVGDSDDVSLQDNTKPPAWFGIQSEATPQKPVKAVNPEFLADSVLGERLNSFRTEASSGKKAAEPQNKRTTKRTLESELKANELRGGGNNALGKQNGQERSKRLNLNSGMFGGAGNDFPDDIFNSPDSSQLELDDDDVTVHRFEDEAAFGGKADDLYNFSQKERGQNNNGPQINRGAAMESMESSTEINEQLIKGVSGVAYNFNQENLMKMREYEKQIVQNSTNLLKEDDVKGFRQYTFDSKYLIDIPLPNPEDYKCITPGMSVRYIIPLAPTGILLAMSLLGMTISSVIGGILIVLTLLSLAFALPSVLNPVLMTPQAALGAYLASKAGRCYGKALACIAVDKSSNSEPDLHELWAPEDNYFKAMLNRLKPASVPALRTVTGADSQNKLLLIHVEEDYYWLLPMVRLNNNWYITRPEMVRHELNREG